MTARGFWGKRVRLVFGLRFFAGFVWVCFFPFAGCFGQVFQRCVEAFFGVIRPGLFGRFPKFLNLGLVFCHGNLHENQDQQA